VRRIRSSPDLLVYNNNEKDLMLFEVKMRKALKETKVLTYRKLIDNYKEFWNDSFLAVVVPCGNVFYAQRMGELQAKEEHNVALEFEKFEDVFVLVEKADLDNFKGFCLKIMQA
jgi:Holliday junction resolvase